MFPFAGQEVFASVCASMWAMAPPSGSVLTGVYNYREIIRKEEKMCMPFSKTRLLKKPVPRFDFPARGVSQLVGKRVKVQNIVLQK